LEAGDSASPAVPAGSVDREGMVKRWIAALIARFFWRNDPQGDGSKR
jgi:hypothetical protein